MRERVRSARGTLRPSDACRHGVRGFAPARPRLRARIRTREPPTDAGRLDALPRHLLRRETGPRSLAPAPWSRPSDVSRSIPSRSRDRRGRHRPPRFETPTGSAAAGPGGASGRRIAGRARRRRPRPSGRPPRSGRPATMVRRARLSFRPIRPAAPCGCPCEAGGRRRPVSRPPARAGPRGASRCTTRQMAGSAHDRDGPHGGDIHRPDLEARLGASAPRAGHRRRHAPVSAGTGLRRVPPGRASAARDRPGRLRHGRAPARAVIAPPSPGLTRGPPPARRPLRSASRRTAPRRGSGARGPAPAVSPAPRSAPPGPREPAWRPPPA